MCKKNVPDKVCDNKKRKVPFSPSPWRINRKPLPLRPGIDIGRFFVLVKPEILQLHEEYWNSDKG